jgi:DNA mismatch endonuclease, patch repair protein
MSRIRAKDTGPEMILRRRLFARGLRYRVRSRLPGKPDLVFPGARLAVFVDGCFWHGCPEHGSRPKSNQAYWDPKLDRNRQRAAEVGAALSAAGWESVRLWEHEIKQELGRTVERLEHLVRARTQSRAHGHLRHRPIRD